MKRPRLVWSLSALAALALLLGGFLWWRAGERAATIAAAIPHRPDLSSFHHELTGRISTAERAARMGPGRLDALRDLGRLYQANGLLTEASQCYQALVQLDGSDPRWAHRLAWIYAGYGQLDDALPLWRAVAKQAPDYLPVRIRIGDTLLRLDRIGEAERSYLEVLGKDASNSYALLGLGRVEMARNNWKAARERMEAAALQTNYIIGGNLLVTIYEKLGMEEQALAIRGMGKASGSFFDVPDPWIDELYPDCFDVFRLLIMSGMTDRTGDTQTAIVMTQRAIQLAPKDVRALFQLAGYYKKLKEPAKAAPLMERCTVLDPGFPDPWIHLYLIQSDEGNEAAVQTLRNGLDACPKSPAMHLEYGRLLAKNGRLQEALEEFQISSRLRPEEADALIEKAGVYFKMNEIDKGIECLNAALVSQPAHPGALSGLAFSAISLNRESEARKWLRQISMQPRISNQSREALIEAFRKQFGHEP
ncbi:MAG: tetratricopeptide repeat protein [Opitutaceae bacterium]|jgi:tetratricopeptide (TPR) repeat protein